MRIHVVYGRYMAYFDVVCKGFRDERETTSESGEEPVEKGEIRVAHGLQETLKPCEREGMREGKERRGGGEVGGEKGRGGRRREGEMEGKGEKGKERREGGGRSNERNSGGRRGEGGLTFVQYFL